VFGMHEHSEWAGVDHDRPVSSRRDGQDGSAHRVYG